GPIFTPEGNEELKQAAANVSDLLMVELSHQNQFQLVEREKVNAIWNELHLTSAGLTASDTVAKLGHVLACDWLLTGSFITTEKGPQVWTKIIDVSSGAVLDFEAVPYESKNVSATVSGVAQFVTRTRSAHRARPILALGTFTEMSLTMARED